MNNFLCKIGFHKWYTLIKAYYKYGVGDCGKVQKCDRCGRVRATGKAYIPDYLKEKEK